MEWSRSMWGTTTAPDHIKGLVRLSRKWHDHKSHKCRKLHRVVVEQVEPTELVERAER